MSNRIRSLWKTLPICNHIPPIRKRFAFSEGSNSIMNRDIMSRFKHAVILCFKFGLMLHTRFSFSRETCNYIKYYKSSYTILLLLIITYYLFK